jgi:gamma-glutamylcyclotransferase (GGCT)/AIG2-like uncharacterized protein YtfP
MDSNTTPSSFFVYGTLRDDDDSGAPWTASWVKDGKGIGAKVFGYKMFLEYSYPAVMQSDEKDFVVGRRITFPPELFKEKLRIADEIENYDENDESNADYLRGKCIAKCEDGDHICYIYYKKTLDNHNAKLIPGGDWNRRKEIM